jgi:hypothetical protein
VRHHTQRQVSTHLVATSRANQCDASTRARGRQQVVVSPQALASADELGSLDRDVVVVRERLQAASLWRGWSLHLLDNAAELDDHRHGSFTRSFVGSVHHRQQRLVGAVVVAEVGVGVVVVWSCCGHVPAAPVWWRTAPMAESGTPQRRFIQGYVHWHTSATQKTSGDALVVGARSAMSATWSFFSRSCYHPTN